MRPCSVEERRTFKEHPGNVSSDSDIDSQVLYCGISTLLLSTFAPLSITLFLLDILSSSTPKTILLEQEYPRFAAYSSLILEGEISPPHCASCIRTYQARNNSEMGSTKVPVHFTGVVGIAVLPTKSWY